VVRPPRDVSTVFTLAIRLFIFTAGWLRHGPGRYVMNVPFVGRGSWRPRPRPTGLGRAISHLDMFGTSSEHAEVGQTFFGIIRNRTPESAS
jgi:hypothetical protein